MTASFPGSPSTAARVPLPAETVERIRQADVATIPPVDAPRTVRVELVVSGDPLVLLAAGAVLLAGSWFSTLFAVAAFGAAVVGSLT